MVLAWLKFRPCAAHGRSARGTPEVDGSDPPV